MLLVPVISTCANLISYGVAEIIYLCQVSVLVLTWLAAV